MASSAFELREFFHLIFLKHLSIRLSGRLYAVKGGICLRFFHKSPRLSEDMDLDVVSDVPVSTLKNAVDSILTGRQFAAALAIRGIETIESSKPKQTETNQRWKVQLGSAAMPKLGTKIEFSRREESIAFSRGIPDAELLKQYHQTPFAAQYYSAEQLVVQKIAAMASSRRYAVRDLFDLHHLFVRGADLGSPQIKSIPKRTIEESADKAATFSHKDFKEQVLPYLPSDLMELYRDGAQFDALQEQVGAALLSLL